MVPCCFLVPIRCRASLRRSKWQQRMANSLSLCHTVTSYTPDQKGSGFSVDRVYRNHEWMRAHLPHNHRISSQGDCILLNLLFRTLGAHSFNLWVTFVILSSLLSSWEKQKVPKTNSHGIGVAKQRQKSVLCGPRKPKRCWKALVVWAHSSPHKLQKKSLTQPRASWCIETTMGQ